jgi:ADP-ribose pyrophosphatase
MSVVYKGMFFTVEQEPRTLPNGREIVAEWVTRTDGVRIIARRDDGAVLVSDEWRPELGRRDYRLPGGKVEGNTPLAAAQAELQEETGFCAGSWVPIGSTQAFSMVRYSLHYFEARDVYFNPIEHDEGEDVKACWFSLGQVVKMALDGAIGEDLSALQLLRLAAREGTA